MGSFRLIHQSFGLLVFAASGVTGLIYQVTWQRWLSLTLGISATSVAVIVAAFLTGLGLGALVGGSLADRLAHRRGWLVFAALELVVAALALGSATVLTEWLPQLSALGLGAPLRTWAILLVLFAVPTVPMGMVLPILVTAVRHTTPLAQAGRVSRLFFANTMGAAVGALVVVLGLAPVVGFDGAVAIGAVINIGCAIVAVGLFVTSPTTQTDAHPSQPAPEAWPPSQWWAAWIAQYFIAGFTLLVYELVAFRVLEHIVKARSFTFGILLAGLLSGYAVGALVGDAMRPGSLRARYTLFFATQVALAAVIVGAPTVVWWLLGLQPDTNVWAQSMAATEAVWSLPVMLLNYLAAPTVLLVVPGMLMGVSFSVTQQLVQTDAATVGRRLGALQTAGVLGSVAGAWVVTQWGFPTLGTVRTLQILGGIGVGYALVWTLRTRTRAAIASLATVASLLVLLPSPAEFWRVLSGSPSADRWLWHEGSHGVSVITFDDDADPWAATVFANGQGQSRLPRAAHPVHVTLGAVPILVHPAPRRVGIIGLGSGTTAWAASARPETEQVVVWELLASQRLLLLQYAERTGDHTADWFVRDPRVTIRHGDGRRLLRLSAESFDVIEADARRPESAMAGHLYSVEFFALVRSRLAQGGIAATWIPTPRVLASFRQVFPHVAVVGELMALGSDSPMDLSWDVMRARLRTPAVDAHFLQAQIDIERLLEPRMAARPMASPVTSQVNTDMRPFDELPSLATWSERFRTRKSR